MFDIQSSKKIIVGMIHVEALPGTPKSKLGMETIIERAKNDMDVYLKAGIDAIMIENMHDVPYVKTEVGPEITAAMTAVAVELRRMTDKPLGIQILAAANKQALAVAYAAGFDFIRAEGFVYGHLADEGYIDSCAGELLRYRKMIGADDIAVYTDIKKKHCSHTISSDVSLSETAKTAEYFLSDGVIVTGISTGEEAMVGDVQCVRSATSVPVLVGSGITAENIHTYWDHAHAFIVGSSLKIGGDWRNGVDPDRVVHLMKEVKGLSDK